MDTVKKNNIFSLSPADWKMIAFGAFAYVVIFTAFASKIGTLTYIGLPFRKMYAPLAGWSILILYSVFHSVFFKTDLKMNLRKMIFLGLILHLSFLLFYLNAQILGASYLSKIYFMYIGSITIASLVTVSFGAYLLKKDLFLFIPFMLLSIHLAIMYLFKGFFECVTISAIVTLLCIAIARIDKLPQLLHAKMSGFFKDERKLIVVLFLMGAIVRLVFAMQILHVTGGGSTFVDASDDGRSFDGNAWTMVTSSEKILQGGSLFPGIWDPGYMFFLSVIYRLAGHNFHAVTLVQSLLGGALSVICYYIAKEILENRSIAILTSVLVNVSQLLIMYMIVLGAEALSIPLLAALILSYISCFKQPENIFYRIAAGVALGLLCITRSLFMALPLFIFITELFTVSKITLGKKIKNNVIIVLVACLLIAPITFINYLNDGKFNLIVKSGARLSTCWSAPVSPWPDISPDNKGFVELGINPFNDLTGSIRVALKEPKAVASTACRIYFKRFQNYFTWPCFGFFDPILLVNNSRIPNVFASSMEFYVYSIFFIGLYYLIKESRKRKEVFVIFAVIIYSILAHCLIITIISVRYRLPIVPYLMMIGAAGMYCLYGFSRKGFQV